LAVFKLPIPFSQTRCYQPKILAEDAQNENIKLVSV